MVEITELILRLAKENLRWGYTRIRGALSNLGHTVSRSTIANILREHGIEPAPEGGERTSWRTFLTAHWETVAATDLFTVDVAKIRKGGLVSRKSGRQIRLDLYAAGNVKCPICLTPFTEDEGRAGETATLEHAPPKAVGGSVMCLTCTSCNAGASGSLDQAVAMRNSAIRDHEAGRGTKMELDIFGTKHTTYFSPDGIAKSRLYSKFASSPLARRFLDESSGREILLLAELTRGPIWESSKGIAMRINQPSPNHVAVSWLRSAYLMVFSLLGKGGYRYAESEAIRPIREQIMKPDKELVPFPLWDLSPLPKPKTLMASDNFIIMKRNRPFCWIAKIGNTGVLLPHAGAAKHYKEVIELPDEITLKHKDLIGWRPAKFGQHFSFEMPLYKESEHVDKDLFGIELTMPVGEYERQTVVVNQQGLICTFLPIGPTP